MPWASIYEARLLARVFSLRSSCDGRMRMEARLRRRGQSCRWEGFDGAGIA